MRSILDGLPVLVILVILFGNIIGAMSSKGKNAAKARKEHLTTIGSNFEKPKSIIQTFIDQNPDAVVSGPKTSSSVNNRKNNIKRLNKVTEEKTHNHAGELRIEGTGLMEDRQNDWLAKQIREEARLHRRQMM